MQRIKGSLPSHQVFCPALTFKADHLEAATLCQDQLVAPILTPTDNNEEAKEAVATLMDQMVPMAPHRIVPRVLRHNWASRKTAMRLRTLTPMTPAMTCLKASISRSHS